MHPLPRVNELDASFDSDRRAVYFQQAAYGVPIRMALISLLLHLQKTKSLSRFSGGFAKPDYPIYAQPIGTGLQCDNPNCITGDPAERQYAASKFYIVDAEHDCRLRCVYCEKDVGENHRADFVVGDIGRKTFSPGLGAVARAAPEKLKHLIIFANTDAATAAGFAPRESAKKLRAV
jgi:Aspartate carbamoyltransferase regulatory chain, metal binding domain/Aspartate/ornithine carbamoyltransferase, Asp/Orn binding domain